MSDIVERLKSWAGEIQGPDVDILYEAAAEISRLRSLTEWRTMESAPKDGRYILLNVPNAAHPLVGHWFDGGKNGWWAAHTMPVQPSGWLPLPPSPNEVGDPAVVVEA